MADEARPDRIAVRTDVRFALIPEWVLDHPDLSDRAVRLYGILQRHADNETGLAYPSRRRLAERLRCSKDSVDRAMKQLVAVGAIVIEHRTTNEGDPTSNLYTVLSHPHGVAAPVQGGGRTGAARGGRTGAARGGRTGAALTRTTRNESQGEGGGAAHASTDTSPPVTAKAKAPLPFPDQCPDHQDDIHYAPCGGCKRARLHCEEQAAAGRELRSAMDRSRPMLRCDTHYETYPEGSVCRGCRSDLIGGA